MSLSDENIQAWRIAVKAAMTKYAIQTNTDADDALSGIDALCDAALERNRLERELKDWNALVMAMTALGVDKEIRDKANIPDLWPNPWHQDCAMVAFFIKGLIDRSEQAEAALAAEREAEALRKDAELLRDCVKHIAKWRKNALAYDRDKSNPPRFFDEDEICLIENYAHNTLLRIDAARSAT